MNAKQTALTFASSEGGVQLIITKSGWLQPESEDPLYHLIIEDNSTEEPKITPMLLTLAKINEMCQLSLDPDRFEQEVIPSKIISNLDEIKTAAKLITDRM